MVGGGLRGGGGRSNGYCRGNDSLGANGIGLMRAHGASSSGGRAVVEDVRQMAFEEGYDDQNEHEMQVDCQPANAVKTSAHPAAAVAVIPTLGGASAVSGVALPAATAAPRLQVVSRRADGKKRITLGGASAAAPATNASTSSAQLASTSGGATGVSGGAGSGAAMTPFQAASNAELQGATNTTEGLSADLLTRRSHQPLMSSSSSSSSSSSKRQRLAHHHRNSARGADSLSVARPWMPPPPLVPLPPSSRPVACQILATGSSSPAASSSFSNATTSSWLECLSGNHGRPLQAVGTSADGTSVPLGAASHVGVPGGSAAAAAVDATFQLVCSMAASNNGLGSSGMGSVSPRGGNASRTTATRWRTLVHGQPTTVCGNGRLAVCGTAEGSVHVFDASTVQKDENNVIRISRLILFRHFLCTFARTL